MSLPKPHPASEADPDGPAPFSFRATKDGRVFVSWHGRPVVTLAGARAAAFLQDIAGAGEAEAQLIMARGTGNFKRGNERGPHR